MKKAIHLWRRGVTVFACVSCAFALAACASATRYTLAQSASSAVAITGDAQKLLPVDTTSDVASIQLLSNEEVQLAVVTRKSAQLAYTGSVPFNQPVRDPQTLLQFYPRTLQLVLNGEGTASEFASLSNKRLVTVGKADDEASLAAPIVLGALGISPSDVVISSADEDEALDMLKNKKVDGLLISAPLPSPVVQKALKLQARPRLVEIPASAQDALNQQPLSVSPCTVAKAIYGLTEDVNTFAQHSVLICGKEITDDQAFELTNALIKNKAILRVADTAANAPAFPYHPGARRALDEHRDSN